MYTDFINNNQMVYSNIWQFVLGHLRAVNCSKNKLNSLFFFPELPIWIQSNSISQIWEKASVYP